MKDLIKMLLCSDDERNWKIATYAITEDDLDWLPSYSFNCLKVSCEAYIYIKNYTIDKYNSYKKWEIYKYK